MPRQAVYVYAPLEDSPYIMSTAMPIADIRVATASFDSSELL